MGKKEEAPPSYVEAMSQTATGQPAGSSGPSHHSQRPPTQPPRPANYSHQQRPPQYAQYQQPSGPQILPVNRVPWTYPPGYHCSKCNSTGKKLKNGKSCQKCWEKFAPRGGAQNVHVQTVYSSSSNSTYGPYAIPFSSGYLPPQQFSSYSSQSQTSNGPRYVRPGDPSIGGVQCGKCRGTGLVRFILDEEHCPVCHGIGRVFV